MKNDKGLIVTVAAFGTATLMVALFSGGSSSDSQLQVAEANDAIQQRFKRSEEASSLEVLSDDYAFDMDSAGCDDWTLEGESCFDNYEDVEMFQRRGKKKKGSTVPTVDLGDVNKFVQSYEGQMQIRDLVSTLSKKINNVHKKEPLNYLAHNGPEVMEFAMHSQLTGLVAGTTWDALDTTNRVDCNYGATGRISKDTNALYMMYPSDMIYETGVAMNDLYSSYQRFFTNLASKMDDDTKIVISSYSGSNIRVNKHHTNNNNLNVHNEMDKLTPGGLAVPNRNGQIKIQQAKLNTIFQKVGATSKKYARNDMPGEQGETCFIVIIIHTLPTDYKDFTMHEVDLTGIASRCTIVPVSVAPSGFIDNFNNLMATIVPESQTFTTLEKGLKGVYSHNAADPGLHAFFDNLADKMTSFMCSVENRVQCMFARKGYVPEDAKEDATEVVEEAKWASTTTEPYTTSFPITESTTTALDDFRGIADDEPDPIFACCGVGLSSKTFDLTKQECCGNVQVGFSIIDPTMQACEF